MTFDAPRSASAQIFGVYFQDTPNLIERVWSFLNHKLMVGNFTLSFMSVSLAIVTLFAAMTVSGMIRKVLQNKFSVMHRMDAGLRYTLLRLLHYIILGLGFLFAIRIGFNADLTTLAVVFTALSVGIGFGLQYIAGDIASGFILLFERPVRVGDFVTIDNGRGLINGRVTSINLRTTVIETGDNFSVIVPNSKLVNQVFTNWSYGHSQHSRIVIEVSVAYDSDVDLVDATLVHSADGVSYVLDDPRPKVQFLRFSESALDFRLLVWTDQPRLGPQIRSDINHRIIRLFQDEGIQIPYPRQELYLHNGTLVATNEDEERAAA
ncbi:MAG: mechanosensitive ion channel domain-containing protein [Pyrinomonadaceae bacterium]